MAQDDLRTIKEIEKAIQKNDKIPASKVRDWLRDPSVVVLGAVVQQIVRNSRRVEPPLSMEEICSIVQTYYKECLVQNLQDSEYAPNRSVAGYELVSWFRSLWGDSAVPRDYLVALKTMLGDLCVKNKVPPDQLAAAVLEHLFETPEIAEFFGDWKTDSALGHTYTLAMQWVEGSRGQQLS